MSESTSQFLTEFLQQEIVLDLQSMYVCLGRLVDSDHRYLLLEQADLHDLRDTTTTRERYLVDARLHGIPINRNRVLINRHEVVGISLLTDIQT